jgi:4-hydroxybenzoate polyprenyltransferase
MDEQHYRKFLQTASRDVRVGWVRIIVSLVAAVFSITYALINQDLALGIIAGLFVLVAWLYWDRKRKASEVFDVVEFVSRERLKSEVVDHL